MKNNITNTTNDDTLRDFFKKIPQQEMPQELRNTIIRRMEQRKTEIEEQRSGRRSFMLSIVVVFCILAISAGVLFYFGAMPSKEFFSVEFDAFKLLSSASGMGMWVMIFSAGLLLLIGDMLLRKRFAARHK